MPVLAAKRVLVAVTSVVCTIFEVRFWFCWIPTYTVRKGELPTVFDVWTCMVSRMDDSAKSTGAVPGWVRGITPGDHQPSPAWPMEPITIHPGTVGRQQHCVASTSLRRCHGHACWVPGSGCGGPPPRPCLTPPAELSRATLRDLMLVSPCCCPTGKRKG